VDTPVILGQNEEIPWRGRNSQAIVANGEGRNEGTTQLQTLEESISHSL
jgi:hypothetical protein